MTPTVRRPPVRARSLLPLLPFVIAAWGCGTERSDDSIVLGEGAYSVAVFASSGELTLVRGGERLLTLPADAFRIGVVPELDDGLSYDPYWLETGTGPFPKQEMPDLEWFAPTGASARRVDDDSLAIDLTYDGATATVTVRRDALGRFSADFVPTLADGDGAIAFLRLEPRADEEEGFYGLGEWPDDVNHRGKLRPMQLQADLEVEAGYSENHVPVPLLIGSRGWGLFVESRRYGLFDVAREDPTLVRITYGTAEQSADGLRFHLFAADHPLDVTRRYYDVTGDPTLPAPWALGPLIWRDENDDQAQVHDDIRKIRELDLATSGIWIDRPYASHVNSFDFHPDLFPDPAAMIADAHAHGLRVSVWHTPYIEKDTGALREEADANGYFPPKAGLSLNEWSTPMDFTNPDAYAWWQGLIGRYRDLGIEGFKLDYGEDIVAGIAGNRSKWQFHDGSDERTMHYGYTLLYHRVYAETLPEEGGFLLCRTGRWGDQKHVSVVWPGDLDATFTKHRETLTKRNGEEVVGVGGLPAALIMGLNLGPSGFPFYGSDTGGYRHSPPRKEVFIRWFQQTALSTVMQVGDSSSQTPWEFNEDNGRDEETLDLYRAFARLHLRLFPYQWTYAKRLADDGRAILRPLGLAYPELGEHPWDTYLFGDELLVAPVLEDGARSREVLLPTGTWIHWFSGATYDGGATGGARVTVPAPLSEIPLLGRAGAMVPLLRPTIDTLAPTTKPEIVDSFDDDAGPLYVRVFPGRGAFTVYDGSKLSQRITSTKHELTFEPGETFGEAIFELVAAAEPTAVRKGEAELARVATREAFDGGAEGWFWEADREGTLRIRAGAGALELVVER